MSSPEPLNNRAPDPIRANLANKHRTEAFRARMRGEGDCGCGKKKAAEMQGPFGSWPAGKHVPAMGEGGAKLAFSADNDAGFAPVTVEPAE